MTATRPEKDLDFTGRTILVTGSGRNIGRAVILEFAARGANCVINARSNRDEAEAVRKEVEGLGAKALVVMGDAGEQSVVQAFKSEAEAAFGRVDIYVSNAAKRLHKSFFDTSDEEWHYHLNQQLSASWYLAKAFTPAMCDAGYGRIIHMNGMDGFHGDWTRVPHSTAKGGLRAFTKSLAAGLGRYGITANEINPGAAETVRDLSTHPTFKDPARKVQLSARIPVGRLTDPSEVAFAAAFLCSPRAAAITGTMIHVDGGRDMLS